MNLRDARCAQLFTVATARWGKDSQMRMVQEECAELIAAINRRDRGRGTHAEVVDEIADVLIMAEQARLLAGPGQVDRAVAEKIERLAGRLEQEP